MYCVIENRVFLAVNLNHIVIRSAVPVSGSRRTFQYAVGVIDTPLLVCIVLVQPGKQFGPAFVAYGFQLYAFILRNRIPAACIVRRFGALQLQVNGLRQFIARNIRCAVLLFPLLCNLYVDQLAPCIDKRCRYSIVIALRNGAAHPFAVLGNGAVFAAREGHPLQACVCRFIFRHNKPCTDRDFVNHNLAVVLFTVLFHLAGVCLRLNFVAEALAADIAELDGKGKFLIFQFLVRGGFLAYNQLAGLDLVGENHLQLGQLVFVSRTAVGAEYERIIIRFLFWADIFVLDWVSFIICSFNHRLRPAIFRGGARNIFQCGNRLAVFVYRPACVVQFGVGYLFQGYVAAAAELILKGDRLTVLQQELAIFIHNIPIATVGGKHGICRVLQRAGCGRAIVWDVVLLGRKACCCLLLRRAAECKVAQVNFARKVIADCYFFDPIVEICIFLQGVQQQPYGVPLPRVQPGRRAVDITALQALGAKATHLLVACVPKLHIQVAQRAGIVLIALLALHIDIKGQVAVLPYINCFTQWQGAPALLSVLTGWVIHCG